MACQTFSMAYGEKMRLSLAVPNAGKNLFYRKLALVGL
jgi:hypothetical protein